MAELKEVLGKYVEAEKLDGAVEELNQELPKQFIPKGRFNEVNEELKVIKTQLEESKKVMETLSQKASSLEEYEKKLSELQKLNSEIEENAVKQVSAITKKTQLKELLLLNNAHKDALELLVDKYNDIVEVENGAIKSPEELLNKIKSERSGLFMETKVESQDKGQHKEPPVVDDTDKLRKLYGLK